MISIQRYPWKEETVHADLFASVLTEEHTLLDVCSWASPLPSCKSTCCKQHKSENHCCPRHTVDRSVHSSEWTKLRGFLLFCEPSTSSGLICSKKCRAIPFTEFLLPSSYGRITEWTWRGEMISWGYCFSIASVILLIKPPTIKVVEMWSLTWHL